MFFMLTVGFESPGLSLDHSTPGTPIFSKGYSGWIEGRTWIEQDCKGQNNKILEVEESHDLPLGKQTWRIKDTDASYRIFYLTCYLVGICLVVGN